MDRRRKLSDVVLKPETKLKREGLFLFLTFTAPANVAKLTLAEQFTSPGAVRCLYVVLMGCFC